jgi:DNA-binding HxlR family transcriptional regulator
VTDSAAASGYEQIDDDLCRGFQEHLEIVGRRWNSAILLAGIRGATRFSEYRAMIAGISDRLLTQRLKELETEGLIERTVIPTTPVSIRYELTENGRELMALLQPLTTWHHGRVGTALTKSKSLTPTLHAVDGGRRLGS